MKINSGTVKIINPLHDKLQEYINILDKTSYMPNKDIKFALPDEPR